VGPRRRARRRGGPRSSSRPAASAALAIALAEADERDDLRLHVRVDERSAGFLALGLAKVAKEPVAVVTTSGTAVANLLPSLVEASYAGVPVIVVSADRPAELRDAGAHQTIDQVKIFGTTVRWSTEVAVAEARVGQVRYWRSVVARAISVATEVGSSGPVHLNVAFRDPLVPDGDDTWIEPLGLADVDLAGERLPVAVDARLGMSAAQPIDRSSRCPLGPTPTPTTSCPRACRRGGRPVRRRGQRLAVDSSPEACGWPLIGEPTGNARVGDSTVAHGALLLADPHFAGEHAPEIVVCVGRPGLSRPVLRMIREAPLVLVADDRAAA
jgi:2-succinyl-5-enolpyruvyl-6-hydroxy-3-cyclohexene-1-carboxylate synthase